MASRKLGRCGVCGVCGAVDADCETVSDASHIRYSGQTCRGYSDASATNRYCMLDIATARIDSDEIQLLASGCPDHTHSRDVVDHRAASDSAACLSSATFAPRLYSIIFSFPRAPSIQPGLPSATAEGIVGVAVNGVPFMSHTMSSIFDNCLGHISQSGQYHYHLPPVCLIHSLGGDANASWWRDGTWPATGRPSPLIGWALDGWPIFGPYDDQGVLMRGRSEAENATLDNCNGKLLRSGGYGYFTTPSAPYTVACFVGRVGKATYQKRAGPSSTCPTSGLNSIACSFANGCSVLSRSPCRLSCENVSFMFPSCPDVGDNSVALARGIGVLYVFTLVILAICGMPYLFQFCWRNDKNHLGHRSLSHTILKKDRCWTQGSDGPMCESYFEVRLGLSRFYAWRIVKMFLGARVLDLVRIAICLMFSRAMVFLIDPYYTAKILPATVVAVLYGVTYPLLNASYFHIVVLTMLQTDAVSPEPDTMRKLAVVNNILQLIVQFVLDIVRVVAMPSFRTVKFVLKLCMVYFIAYGMCTTLACFALMRRMFQNVSQRSPRIRSLLKVQICLVVCLSLVKAAHGFFSTLRVAGFINLPDFEFLVIVESFPVVETLLTVICLLVIIAFDRFSISTSVKVVAEEYTKQASGERVCQTTKEASDELVGQYTKEASDAIPDPATSDPVFNFKDVKSFEEADEVSSVPRRKSFDDVVELSKAVEEEEATESRSLKLRSIS